MPSLILLIAAFLMGCASSPPAPQGAQLAESLGSAGCESDEFRGTGIGKSENEALNLARSDLAMQINSSLNVQTKYRQSQQVLGGKENIGSEYESELVMKSNLLNAHDARVARVERRASETGAVVCMSRANAAKGFVEKIRPVADSLKFAASSVIDAKHPKLKSEAWHKTKPLWGKFIGLYSVIENLDKEKSAPFEPVSALYAKAETYYLDFCQTAKLYWNPEQNDVYSEIAFSKLSKNLKLEKAACKGHGISLVYKNTGHKCEYAGMFECVHKPSLLIASCYGEEYRLLENENIETYQKVEAVALEKLHEKLRYETFWNEWEQEIKQWRPICE